MQSRPSQDPRQLLTPTTSASFVQVCDRCRWKKIKCVGSRPCSACRNASFPCETRARLSKQATPRSYVQYLESRVRQLEGHHRDSDASSQSSAPRSSPRGNALTQSAQSAQSPDSSNHPKNASLPDWTVLKELGTHVVDEDGLVRYMGPSSGVGFAATILQEILDDEQPQGNDYFSLFCLDDLMMSRKLEQGDIMLWDVDPTHLPPREVADGLLHLFFTFTERTFPVLHRPSFLQTVDDLYNLDAIESDTFEHLSQFYFVLSIGHCFNTRIDGEQRASDQIRALLTAAKCYYTCIHKRRDGLVRLQTLTLYSYSLVLLRQWGEALRISAMANTKALECGLHHDGFQFHGNPLETEMRRRVFWCVFMLHLSNSSLEGLPRALHEADITIAEPSDIDDDQLTTTEFLNTLPGRTKIHRFVAAVRLIRILSRTLDVLYSQNRRKHASTRIEQMNRLCCEHLLDQLDFSFEETPDDMPSTTSSDPTDLAILASYANEQCLFYYIRWLIHRPAATLRDQEPHLASCLPVSTDAAAGILGCLDVYWRACPFITFNPAAHPCTAFVAALTPLYRTWLLKTRPASTVFAAAHGPPKSDVDAAATRAAINYLEASCHDHSDVVRRRVLQALVEKVFGDDYQELQRSGSIQSIPPQQQPRQLQQQQSHQQPQQPYQQQSQSQQQRYQQQQPAQQHQQQHLPLDYREHQIAHATAHEDLRSFVHEAFSPGVGGLWAPGDPAWPMDDM